MKKSLFVFTGNVIAGCLALASVGGAQVLGTLKHALPAPPVGVQAGGWFGWSVATAGGLTVVGAPLDDTGAESAGAVKVFDSATGALLHALYNPSPGKDEWFGWAVAIAGTRVVVGTPNPPFPGTDSTSSGGGTAYVYDLGGATPTVPVAALDNPEAALFDHFGYSVAISGTRVVIGAYTDDTGAIDAGSAYVFDLASATPTIPIATLNNPNPAAEDGFGYSVAISGTRVVVGALGDFTDVDDAGMVYIYDLSEATPTAPVATLSNADPAAGDRFGTAVAIAGSRVVVGVPGDGTGADGAGSTHVYDLSSATPTVPVTMLHNPDPATSDFFGNAVAISGGRVAVGAVSDNAGGEDMGSAYVYDLNSSTPTVPIVTLESPEKQAPGFGRSVAMSSTRMVVGGPINAIGPPQTGSAYLYEISSGTPTVPVAKLQSPGPSAGDLFGDSVAISGTRLAVGSYTPLNFPLGIDSGSVYVYDLMSGTPTVPLATLNNPRAANGDTFGDAVDISGARIVVGAATYDMGLLDVGIVYVYDLTSPAPAAPVLTLNNPSPAYQDEFGNSVAISGSLVVVGAWRDRTGAHEAGSAYVYDLTSGSPTVPRFTLNNPTPAIGDRFGSSVAVDGMRVVVAAYNGIPGRTSARDAYVYDLTSGTPTVPVATLNHPGPPGNHHFGNAVGISGTRVVVGAWQDDTHANDAGSAYVYDVAGSTPTLPVAILNNPAPAVRDYFGYSVAISGTQVVVGAYADDTGATDAGSAYIYDLSTATPTIPVATLNHPGPGSQAEDLFGWSVAIDGTTVAIGTPSDDTVMTNKGYAYVYGPNPNDHDNDGLLDSWELTYWPTTAGHSQLDDFDHDGYPELLELAFGLNPTLPESRGLPGIKDEGGYLTMKLTKYPGVAYEIQSAGTLVAGRDDSFSPATTTVLTETASTLKARDNFLIETASRRFMRVWVTAAP